MNAPLWKHRLSNWSCGVLTVLVGLAVTAVVAPLWVVLQRHAVVGWPAHPAVGFGLALLALDFLYYWLHRAEHRSRALWAIHSVHHQSTICDASVSLRTSALAPVSVIGSHVVLALFGLPFELYVAAYLAHTAVVFMLHTRLPGVFNRASWVFNSPYLHRAHHSTLPRLRGKNLGGVLVIWDRLFGTFEADCDDAHEFGIGRAPTPLSPVAAHAAAFRSAFGARQRLARP